MADTPLTSKTYEEYEALRAPVRAREAVESLRSKQQELHTYRDAYDWQGRDVTVFSRTGDVKSEADFERAINFYNESKGKNPEGFVVLPEGDVRNLRVGFEKSRKPVQAGVERFGRTVGGVASLPGSALALLLEKAGVLPQGAGSEVLQTGQGYGEAAGRFAASPLDRPEIAGALTLAAAGPFIGAAAGLSALPTAVITGLAAGTGAVAAGAATGSDVSPGLFATQAMLAFAGYGVSGLLAHALKRSPSQRASAQVSEDIINTLKRKYGHLANDPHQLENVVGTPAELSEITQKGLRVFIGDVGKAGTLLHDDIVDRARGHLGKGSLKDLSDLLSKYGDKVVEMLNAERGSSVRAGLVSEVKALREEVINTFYQGLSGTGKTSAYYDTLRNSVSRRINAFERELSQYESVIDLFKLLKESGADKRFIVRELQKTLLPVYATGDPLLSEVGRAAGRGAPLASGIDVSYGRTGLERALKGIGIPESIVNAISRSAPNIRLGERYVGTVRGTAPATQGAVTAASQQAIRSFLEESARQK